jgi:NadR type nicotinamide-nucleotide adenylyltransferase
MEKKIKIVLIGGESTGKTTLCTSLAFHFQTLNVEEFARRYLQAKNGQYEKEDLILIAQAQIKLEDDLTQKANNYLFLDTDLQVLKVWSEHKYHGCDSWILNEIARRKYDAYILCSPDFAWEFDPLRENSEATWRRYFHLQYLDIVQQANIPFIIVEGNEENRLSDAIAFLNQTFSIE